MLFGTSKRVITPPMPVRLSGYASRTQCFRQVEEDIYIRVHVQRTAKLQLIFIYGDLIWWNPLFVDAARARLKKELGLDCWTLIFTASHNHSGPGTGNCFIPRLEKSEDSYVEYLMKTVCEAVYEALENLDEVTVWRFEGNSDMNVFRRLKLGDRIEMRPNFRVPADNALTILGLAKADGDMKGLVVHYACHANISGENTVQPDYPGIALRLLDEAYPGCVSMFWQGCTGDLRPRNILGSHFAPGDYEKARLFAEDFTDDCMRVLSQSGRRVEENLSVEMRELLLPLENRKSTGQLRECLTSHDEVQREWAAKVLEKDNPEHEKLRMKYVKYGKELAVFFFGAEMSQEYAAYARALNPAALCVGYTDGMAGYVCTGSQIKEGGYEPCGSARYFALGGSYPASVEELIKKEMKEMEENDGR